MTDRDPAWGKGMKSSVGSRDGQEVPERGGLLGKLLRVGEMPHSPRDSAEIRRGVGHRTQAGSQLWDEQGGCSAVSREWGPTRLESISPGRICSGRGDMRPGGAHGLGDEVGSPGL